MTVIYEEAYRQKMNVVSLMWDTVTLLHTSVFWDVMPCSVLEVFWQGRGIPASRVTKGNSWVRVSGVSLKQQYTWRKQQVALKCPHTSSRQHHVTSRARLIFIITTVRTPTVTKTSCCWIVYCNIFIIWCLWKRCHWLRGRL